MTEMLYMNDSYMRQFTAKVVEVKGNLVALDKTAFYPGGGGQPHDMGTLLDGQKKFKVVKASKAGDNILHEVEGDAPSAGADVIGMIDWDRRYKLMRTHTALHILCGVIWRDYGAKVTGGDMKLLEARMDFELEQMSADFAHEVEERVNKEVEAGREVLTKVLPREEAFKIPELIRTKINLLPDHIKEVRIVDISGLDLQADGGTHVVNTREVGTIKVVGHESKGRINKRLRIAIE